MWKRILAGFFIGASLLVMGSVGHAVNGNKTETVSINKDNKKYEVTNPKKAAYSTEDKVVFINGTAPAKAPIVLKLYGTTDLTGKNFNLDKLPSDKDYINILEETIHAGNMGFFQKQLDLIMGINKVILDFGGKDQEHYEIIVYVYDKAPTLTEIISKIK